MKEESHQTLCFTDRIVCLQYTQIQDKYLYANIHFAELWGSTLSLLFLLLFVLLLDTELALLVFAFDLFSETFSYKAW